MSSFGQMTLTEYGKEKYAEIMAAGAPITFLRFELGSGETQTPAELYSLVNKKMDVGISSAIHEDNRVTISARFTNMSVFSGFYAKELGLYIDDLRGNDVLFAYFSDAHPDYIPAENIRVVDVPITVTLVISDTQTVTASVNLDNVATIRDVQAVQSQVEETIGSRLLSIDDIYPVGTIYISMNTTSPNMLFPGTSWEHLPVGRMLLVTDHARPPGTLGGEATHTLTMQEMPTHTHSARADNVNLTGILSGTRTGSGWSPASEGIVSELSRWSAEVKNGNGDDWGSRWRIDASHGHNVSLGTSGGGVAHNNMPPYIAVSMWRRIQ